MNATPAILIASKDAASSVTLEYTSPASGKGTLIDYFIVFNHDSAQRTVTVHFATDGAAAADSNQFVSARSMAIDEPWIVPLVGAFLPPGGKIYVGASAATAISMTAGGRELTS